MDCKALSPAPLRGLVYVWPCARIKYHFALWPYLCGGVLDTHWKEISSLSLLFTDTFVVALSRAAEAWGETAKKLCLPLWPSLLRSGKCRHVTCPPWCLSWCHGALQPADLSLHYLSNHKFTHKHPLGCDIFFCCCSSDLWHFWLRQATPQVYAALIALYMTYL